jgi:hypothetical protein
MLSYRKGWVTWVLEVRQAEAALLLERHAPPQPAQSASSVVHD